MADYIKKIILCSLFVVFISILIYSSILSYPLSCKNDDFILKIKEGSNASSIAYILEENGCINSLIFKIATYITFNQKNIKPGLYSLKGIRSLRDLMKIITSVSNDKRTITIFEGWKIIDIANSLSERLNIDEEVFIDYCYNKDFIKTLGISYNVESLEGFLYPDTYVLLSTYTEKDIIRILTRHFMDVFNRNINLLSVENDLSVVEIITMASIIQGEAMIVNEMPIISSVYHNRLKIGKELEADPTILYYMSNEDLNKFKEEPGSKKSSKVFRKYKNINNPYNTYMNKKLPVGPINNPGLAALKAATTPELLEKEYLYFVADGTGGHIFSRTFKEHKNAIRKIRNGY